MRRTPLVCLVAAAAAGCGRTAAGPSGTTPLPADARTGGGEAAEAEAMAERPRVILSPSGRAPQTVTVALARTPAERERGLMYVQNLPLDGGMLFIFERDEEQTFWMKNTLIPLDMIFIRGDLTVAGVVADAKPMTLTGRTVGQPSRYVLEVNGGWAAAHGVAAGTQVRFEGFAL